MKFEPIWHYCMIDYGESLGTLDQITQYMQVCSSIAGESIRVRLDNTWNKGRMDISNIYVYMKDSATKNSLSVRGNYQICLQPGESVYTDELAFSISPSQSLILEIRFRRVEGIIGICQTWSNIVWHSWFEKENQIYDCMDLFDVFARDVHKVWASFGVSQIEVKTQEDILEIAMFGDSITNMSYYSDALFERILHEFPNRAVLLNCGIGGNRLCYDAIYNPYNHGNGKCFGTKGVARFERDLYTLMHPNVVLSLIGTNDCTQPLDFGYLEEFPSLEQYSEAYQKIIACAHRHDSAIYLGTILPFQVPTWASFLKQADRRRREYNQWIRSQSFADGIIDFDFIAEDPLRKGKLLDGFDLGDGLHPGKIGGKLMADIIPLSHFFAKKTL